MGAPLTCIVLFNKSWRKDSMGLSLWLFFAIGPVVTGSHFVVVAGGGGALVVVGKVLNGRDEMWLKSLNSAADKSS